MAYLMADGHDVALGSLAAIVPQPRSTAGVQSAQRDLAADGSVFETGLFIVLEWTSLGSVAEYQTLLGQLGLDSALRNAITLYAPDFERATHRYNGWAIRPRATNYSYFPRDVLVIVRDLVQLGEP
jgi:hypothetical protein